MAEGLRRISGLLECDVREELLVYLPHTDTAVALNGSARAVWELCRDHMTMDRIAERLGLRFGVPAEALMPDIRIAVDRLRGFGLLAEGEASDA